MSMARQHFRGDYVTICYISKTYPYHIDVRLYFSRSVDYLKYITLLCPKRDFVVYIIKFYDCDIL